jgi:hypothetical protein
MASSGMLCRVVFVRTGVSEELSACIFRATRIGELGAALAVTSNRRTLRRIMFHTDQLSAAVAVREVLRPTQGQAVAQRNGNWASS